MWYVLCNLVVKKSLGIFMPLVKPLWKSYSRRYETLTRLLFRASQSINSYGGLYSPQPEDLLGKKIASVQQGWNSRSYSLVVVLSTLTQHFLNNCNTNFTIPNVMKNEKKNYILRIARLEPLMVITWCISPMALTENGTEHAIHHVLCVTGNSTVRMSGRLC